MKLDIASSVKSADRAFDILEYVASAGEPPSFSQLICALEIPRSSLFHLLKNMLARGYLEQDSTSDRYRLGSRIRGLASSMEQQPLETLVSPYLEQLSAKSHETCGFYVQEGDLVRTVSSATSNQALAYTMRKGETAPLYAVSGGKIILALFSSGKLAEYIERVKFERFTANTLSSKRQLREQLVVARKEGFAYSRDEFTPGITGIATAVVHDGKVYGAVNFAVPTVRFTPERDVKFRELLKSASATLGQFLSSKEHS